ncbi:hypothetical protein AVEN_59620-1 [Araneus ventricosus]|uniref:Uncharacterized protein n=1 Tax=Araneus ventricosus TaxID=182803 RepID=A0A4Y2KG81_ARAVE|nr:hypothetical protein AVEN_59620-1 [Araneus ventricosus]
MLSGKIAVATTAPQTARRRRPTWCYLLLIRRHGTPSGGTVSPSPSQTQADTCWFAPHRHHSNHQQRSKASHQRLSTVSPTGVLFQQIQNTMITQNKSVGLPLLQNNNK